MPKILSPAAKLRLEGYSPHTTSTTEPSSSPEESALGQQSRELNRSAIVATKRKRPAEEPSAENQNISNNSGERGKLHKKLKKRKREAGSTQSAPPATTSKPKPAPSEPAAETTVTTRAVETTTKSSTKKSRKHRHLFRIKVGCVVALRMGKTSSLQVTATSKKRKRSGNLPAAAETAAAAAAKDGGSSSSKINSQSTATANSDTRTSTVDFSSYVTVWTSPDPRRDVGRALVGHRIRCSIPKPKKSPTPPSGQQQPPKQPQQRTVLEGEIICILDDASPSHCADRMTVELLVDERVLPHFAQLRRTDRDDDRGGSDGPSLSSKARKRLALERQIRGRGTAVVQVALLRPHGGNNRASSVVPPPKGTTTSWTTSGLKWVIQKRVPPKLFHRPRRTVAASAAKNKKDAAAAANREDAAAKNTATATKTSNNNISNSNNQNGESAAGLSTRDSESKLTKGNGKHQQQTQSPPPAKKQRRSSTTAATTTTTSNANDTAVRHVGDGNDSPEQQISNWRWLAGRYHDMRRMMMLPSEINNNNNNDDDDWGGANSAELLSAGFLGHVLSVEPGAPWPSPTLAVVTVRRLFWPEHTAVGRRSHQQRHPNHVFADADQDLQIRVPIEQLVIVGRQLRWGAASSSVDDGGGGAASEDDDTLVAPYSYSFRHDNFHPIAGEDSSPPQAVEDTVRFHCHRCRRPMNHLTECAADDCPLVTSAGPARFCRSCLKLLAKRAARMGEETNYDNGGDLPCCTRSCDCRSCVSRAGSELHARVLASVTESTNKLGLGKQSATATTTMTDGEESGGFLDGVVASIRAMEPVDFALPHNFLDPSALPIPQAKPSTRIKKTKTPKKPPGKRGRPPNVNSSISTGRKPGRPRTPTRKGAEKEASNEEPQYTGPKEDYTVFKPTCARSLVYDPTQKKLPAVTWRDPSVPHNREQVRNIRDVQEHNSRLLTEKKDDSTKALSSSRAARANQRRLMKDVASLGVGAASLGVDALASREPQLRFDRSGIHAWGVFADEDIAADEMIVEYRGELIGNAVAERREIEYEAAKIGSDYMFRIDALNVCDATKQGNVARFINASCDPNCHTKIITMEGTKRIVIYAKKDINVGDELCYDYKFPFEYDESKRIPCHCGAKDCRGFMNWDKRYIVAPEDLEEAEKKESSHRPLKCASEDDGSTAPSK